MDITKRLHNTALQRVDRCASAHGTKAYVGFLDPRVVRFSMRIPQTMKIRNGIEKWILREAVREYLPEDISLRTKSKFWQGSGVGEQLLEYASQHITDRELAQDRRLPDGSDLNTVEELLYYRIFKEHFGDANNIAWVGRTKRAPRTMHL
jgi:asparagine synthase (glutamine-hydrolysing)